MEGNTALGASSPANPALHRPEPLSQTSAVLSSSSHMFLAGPDQDRDHCGERIQLEPLQGKVKTRCICLTSLAVGVSTVMRFYFNPIFKHCMSLILYCFSSTTNNKTEIAQNELNKKSCSTIQLYPQMFNPKTCFHCFHNFPFYLLNAAMWM